MPGSADLERSVIVASLLPSSRGLTSQGKGSQSKRKAPWEARAAEALRSREPSRASLGRGRHLDKSFGLSILFYLLLYLHLVVQVMSGGVSLGRGSTKADFLVIKKREG